MAQRITISELARRLGVSVCTVNKALSGKPKISEKTRERVIEEARRLGYRPNRMARVLARNPIRLAYLHPAHFESFFSPFEAGVRLAAQRLADHQVSVSVHGLPSRRVQLSGLAGLAARHRSQAYLGGGNDRRIASDLQEDQQRRGTGRRH